MQHERRRSRGLIFDLDGVLIDSEGLYYRAYSQVLARYGVTVRRDEYETHWIAKGPGPEDIVAKHGLPVSPDELRRLRSPIFLRLLETVATLMPDVHTTLRRLAPDFRMSVATNSNRAHLDLVLRRFDLEQYFPVTVARQDYRLAKPNPDAFLAAATKLGLAPDRCVAVEDTQRGVTAATSAGMACIAVPNEYTLRNDFSQARLVVPNLAALTRQVVEGLFSRGVS